MAFRFCAGLDCCATVIIIEWQKRCSMGIALCICCIGPQAVLHRDATHYARCTIMPHQSSSRSWVGRVTDPSSRARAAVERSCVGCTSTIDRKNRLHKKRRLSSREMKHNYRRMHKINIACRVRWRRRERRDVLILGPGMIHSTSLPPAIVNFIGLVGSR